MEPEDLYGLPLERFVPERAALAKELRSRGEREEAARAANLTKPSTPAWAVNQLMRTQGTAVRALLAAGDGLRGAQEDVVAGRGSAQALREAAERERDAVAALTQAAGRLLSGNGRGLGAAALERVSETLHAAALDEEAREAVSGGCLTRELRHVGLGADLAAPGGGAATRPDARAARERSARLAAAERDEREALEHAEHAARELEDAERRRAAAAEALEEADEALRVARKTAKETARAHRQAREVLERR